MTSDSHSSPEVCEARQLVSAAQTAQHHEQRGPRVPELTWRCSKLAHARWANMPKLYSKQKLAHCDISDSYRGSKAGSRVPLTMTSKELANSYKSFIAQTWRPRASQPDQTTSIPDRTTTIEGDPEPKSHCRCFCRSKTKLTLPNPRAPPILPIPPILRKAASPL